MGKNTARHILRSQLKRIEYFDQKQNYTERNKLVFSAISTALSIGYEAGFRIDPKELEWPVAYIKLPTGQVSWHIPQHVKEWDKHTTAEKYQRIALYAEIVDFAVPTTDG